MKSPKDPNRSLNGRRPTEPPPARPLPEDIKTKNHGGLHTTMEEPRVRQLVQKEKELEALFSALLDGVVVYDTSATIIKASRSAIEACEDIIGKTAEDLMVRLSVRRHDGTSISPDQLPVARALNGEKVVREPLLLEHPDGRALSILTSASPIYIDDRLVGAVTVSRDVTEMEKGKAELRKILETVPIGLAVADRKGRITAANQEAEDLCGRPLPYGEEIESHARLNFIHKDGRPFNPEELPLNRTAFRGETHKDFEMGVIQPNGERRDLLVYSSPIFDSAGNVNGGVAAFMDITERKGMEEELRIAKESLEQRIQERTSKLEQEINRRQKVEKGLKAATRKLVKHHRRRKFLAGRLVNLLEKDRRDVASTLHDQVGQILTTLKMDLESLEPELKSDSSRERLEYAQEKVSEVISYVKYTSRRLRPSILDTLGLIPAIRSLIDEVKETFDCHIDFFTKGDFSDIRKDKQLAVYRISQEALTNIMKHSSAKRVFINLIKRENIVTLDLEDDGKGFVYEKVVSSASAEMGYLGIQIMRERAAQINANFRIESHPGKGTQVMLKVPV